MKTLSATLLAAALLSAGCASQVPVAETYPLTYQKKAKAVHHWDVLATDVAAQTKASLEKNDYLAGRPLFVEPSPDRTAFGRAFGDLLVTRLVDDGLPVSPTRDGAVIVTYRTQVVQHNSERPHYSPGTLTLLTAGVLVARDLALYAETSSQIAGGLGLVGATDAALGHAAGGPTKTEVVVTTSIVADDRFVLRKSDVYYLEDVDASLFRAPPPIPPRVRHWEVVDK